MDESERIGKVVSMRYYYGRMPFVFYRFIGKCLSKYEFDELVISELFSYAKKHDRQYNLNYLEDKADEWKSLNYSDPDIFFQNYGQYIPEIDKIIRFMRGSLRIYINSFEREEVERWATNMNCTLEIVKYAYENNKYRGEGNIRFKNIDDTICRWFELGMTDLSSAKRIQKQIHDENKKNYLSKLGYRIALMLSEEEYLLAAKHAEKYSRDISSDIISTYFSYVQEDN